jgi:hypothetical protein
MKLQLFPGDRIEVWLPGGKMVIYAPPEGSHKASITLTSIAETSLEVESTVLVSVSV